MAQSLSVTDVLNLIDAGFVSANELFQAYELILKYLSAGASMDVNDSKRFFKLAMIVYHGEKRRKANTSIGSSEVPSTSKDIQQGGTLNLTSVRKESPKQTAKYFRILSEQERLIKKFGVTSRSVTLKFNNPNIEQGPIEWLKNALDEVINTVTDGYSSSDRLGMILTNDNFPDKPICFAFRRMDQLSSAVMMTTLDKILQSNVSFFSDDTLRLQVDRITLPVGYGKTRQRMTGVTFEEFCRRKPGIIPINNLDNLCLARALVVAIAWRENDPDFLFMKKGYSVQAQKAHQLCQNAGVDLSNGGTLEHIEQFQTYLVRYTIVVYNHRLGSSVYFEGPRSTDRIVLNLILEAEHYNVITSLTSAFSTQYFCEFCRVRQSKQREHKNCKYICPRAILVLHVTNNLKELFVNIAIVILEEKIV
ncbi:hypothetical protein RN001_006180 [Aquatica leii]|uniref:Uncharacterized protein n=1 Tax=Aquatica leii TaxID=1421715 RepID=A0AAN7PKV1_9COLE|nr:hypothetical protein RN001_006180 [Aquatica leii]